MIKDNEATTSRKVQKEDFDCRSLSLVKNSCQQSCSNGKCICCDHCHVCLQILASGDHKFRYVSLLDELRAEYLNNTTVNKTRVIGDCIQQNYANYNSTLKAEEVEVIRHMRQLQSQFSESGFRPIFPKNGKSIFRRVLAEGLQKFGFSATCGKSHSFYRNSDTENHKARNEFVSIGEINETNVAKKKQIVEPLESDEATNMVDMTFTVNDTIENEKLVAVEIETASTLSEYGPPNQTKSSIDNVKIFGDTIEGENEANIVNAGSAFKTENASEIAKLNLSDEIEHSAQKSGFGVTGDKSHLSFPDKENHPIRNEFGSNNEINEINVAKMHIVEPVENDEATNMLNVTFTLDDNFKNENRVEDVKIKPASTSVEYGPRNQTKSSVDNVKNFGDTATNKTVTEKRKPTYKMTKSAILRAEATKKLFI